MWKYAVTVAEETPVTAPLLLCGDICDSLRKASALGYDAIELHTRETTILDYDKILRTSKECGAHICMIVSGRLYTEGKCSLIDDAVYSANAAIEGMKTYIHIAQKLGADMLIGWAKGVIPPHGDRKRYLKSLAEKLHILNEYGKARGVRINLEVINRYETNIFNTAKETVDFLNGNNLDNCYVHLDTFHMGIEETDPYEAIRYCGKKLGYLHVSDNTRKYPGSGQFNFKKIMAVLEEVGYNDYVSVECLPEPDRETAARKAIENLKNCAQQ
jgi:sugar phosphate isomerase/epimerase